MGLLILVHMISIYTHVAKKAMIFDPTIIIYVSFIDAGKTRREIHKYTSRYERKFEIKIEKIVKKISLLSEDWFRSLLLQVFKRFIKMYKFFPFEEWRIYNVSCIVRKKKRFLQSLLYIRDNHDFRALLFLFPPYFSLNMNGE